MKTLQSIGTSQRLSFVLTVKITPRQRLNERVRRFPKTKVAIWKALP